MDYVNLLLNADPKRRTLVLVGPSNTGKSFLGKMLTVNTWTTGMVDRMDSVNPHSYAYAFFGQTCCLIEEPLFTVDNCETYKLVMGGEPMLLNPKNCEPFVSESSAFVVITCNGIPWQRYVALPYENRSFIYTLDQPVKFSSFITVQQFWTCFKRWSLQQSVVG